MEPTCDKVNVFIYDTADNPLNGYVVLAFFVSFILTIVIALLLVKYVTYYMQKDRKRIQENLETQHLPRLPRQESDPNSSLDEMWSDSDADIDVNELQSLHSDDLPIDQDLETNYVSTFGSHKDLKDTITKYELLAELKNKNIDEGFTFIPSTCLTEFLFPDICFTKGSKTMDIFDLFFSKRNEVLWLRKSLISSHIDFILGLLCEKHYISQEDQMKLQGKYEQTIDDHHSDLSPCVQNITIGLTTDLTLLNEELNVITLDKMFHYLHQVHLDCLKCFTSDVNGIGDFVNDFESLRLECIMDMQFYYRQIICRVISIQKFMKNNEANKKQVEDLMNNFKDRTYQIFDEIDAEFQTNLKNMIWQGTKHCKEELAKLSRKYEREFASLKYKVFETKKKDIIQSVEVFNQYIVSLHMDYIQEKSTLTLELNELETQEIRMYHKVIYKLLLSKIAEIEEDTFSSLREQCNVSDDDMILITTAMQEHLKEMKQNNIFVRKQVMDNHDVMLDKWTRVTVMTVEYMIKSLSTEFRIVKNSFQHSLHQVPVFSDEVIEDLLRIVQKSFSVVIFDIFLVFIEDIFNQTRKLCIKAGPNTKTNNLMNLLHDTKDCTLTDFTTTLEQFDHLILKAIDCDDIPFQDVYQNHKSIIDSVFTQICNSVIKEEIEPMQASLTLEYFNKQLDLDKKIQKLLSTIDDTTESPDEQKSKKYLSRKGSSYSEKTRRQRLFDCYSSLIGQKQTKLKEISDSIETKRTLGISGKEKTGGIAGYTEVLKKALSVANDNSYDEYFLSLLKCEEEYMIRRFGKKIQLFLDEEEIKDKKDDIVKDQRDDIAKDRKDDNILKDKKDDIVKRKSKSSISLKSRNVVSPEPSVKESSGSTKKQKKSKKSTKK